MADKTQEKVSTTQDSEEALTGKLPYTLTNDFFFKAFLQRNEIALRGLLCAILSMKTEEITDVVLTYRNFGFHTKSSPRFNCSMLLEKGVKTGVKHHQI